MEQAPARPVTLWPATPHSVRRARHALLTLLDAWELGGIGDSAALVLSELMTNAVRHGHVSGRGIGTRFVRHANGLRIEVHDCADAKPELQSPEDTSEHGRGLALVEVVTGGRWGVTARQGPGKVVWAELLG